MGWKVALIIIGTRKVTTAMKSLSVRNSLIISYLAVLTNREYGPNSWGRVCKLPFPGGKI